jgi:dinuclear metal center YbgI/SA1388 family protein
MSCPRLTVLSALDALAPLHLAEPWDNVGLLVDPGETSPFRRAFLVIDLTETTMEEALEKNVDLIVAYHPPIFSGLKRLRASAPSERLVVHALRRGITIYSPHTALDAVSGGMADWLADFAGEGKKRPITPFESLPGAGSGRFIELNEAIDLETAVLRTKSHLGLTHVRVSKAPGTSLIKTIAVCPGAGGSVFEKVPQVDLLLTGEMRHHDVLSRSAVGTHVILCEHTNTERGYLPHLAEKLRRACLGLDVTVSEGDGDPLAIA